MRLWSTPESVRKGEITVLAVAETIAAMGISLWIAWRYETVAHIAISAAIAPFLLLRTPLATRYGLLIAEKGLTRLEVTSATFFYPKSASGREQRSRLVRRRFIQVLIEALSLPFLSLFSRIYSTVRGIFHDFRSACSNIAANWFHANFATDFCHSPELFLGAKKFAHKRLIYYDIYKRSAEILVKVLLFLSIVRGEVRKIDLRGVRLMIVVTAVTLGIIFAGLLDLLVFAPAIAYRWSVKSTSLVWLPLIWIVTSADARRGVYDRLVMLVESPWSRAMRAWSVVVTLLFLAKLALLFQLWRMAGLAGTGPLGEVVQRIVAPVELPLWQVMSFVNAVLAWAFWFRARDHLIAHERRSAYAWPEAWIRTEYAIFTVVRNTITLYVIACTLYIVATTALRANWPPLCLVLFPWSEATCFTFSRPPP